ncbi:MAG: CoA pyrophosphatase [Pseudomonadota bacterium]
MIERDGEASATAAGIRPKGSDGEDIHVAPPNPCDGELADILSRAAALDPAEDASAGRVIDGDHALNPHLTPAADEPPPRDAAVLLALTAGEDGALSLVFTERAAHLPAHPGQVALPGGKIEKGETPRDAALREAFEEIALPTDALQVIGRADHYVTRTGFRVVPVLALVRRKALLVPDPGEVSSVFVAPWRHVMSVANQRQVAVSHNGTTRRFYEIMYRDRRIWGVTAGILRAVNERLRRE